MKLLNLFFILFFVMACGKTNLHQNDANRLQNNATTNCNANSGPLCGQPPMPDCPPNMFCVQVMPQPVTYQNECLMKEAKATLIGIGACPRTTL